MDQKFKQRREELTNKEITDESTLLAMLPIDRFIPRTRGKVNVE